MGGAYEGNEVRQLALELGLHRLARRCSPASIRGDLVRASQVEAA
jgi:hypothetical protein